jgi:hypothetical protein
MLALRLGQDPHSRVREYIERIQTDLAAPIGVDRKNSLSEVASVAMTKRAYYQSITERAFLPTKW